MRLLIIVFIFCFELITAQEVQKNLFGFATSNTFTYCNVNDTSFMNKITDLKSKIIAVSRRSRRKFLSFW